MKLLRNGTDRLHGSSAGAARLTAALALTGLLLAVLTAFGAARYATSAAAQAIPGGPGAAQYEYRPGWGCGDRNHIHTGPPGNQYATMPPGCAKARAANIRARCAARVAKAKAKANISAKKAKAIKRRCLANAAKANRRP